MGSTWYLFTTNPEWAAEREENGEITALVEEYGVAAIFYYPLQKWGTYLLLCFMGAIITGIFLFNKFRRGYSDVVVVAIIFEKLDTF